jgi:hypothetical protein
MFRPTVIATPAMCIPRNSKLYLQDLQGEYFGTLNCTCKTCKVEFFGTLNYTCKTCKVEYCRTLNCTCKTYKVKYFGSLNSMSWTTSACNTCQPFKCIDIIKEFQLWKLKEDLVMIGMQSIRILNFRGLLIRFKNWVFHTKYQDYTESVRLNI